jgi:hypothetical protein
VTSLLREAEDRLRRRELEYHEALALHAALQRRLHLLEATSQDTTSVTALAQQLAMHARPVPRTPGMYPRGVLETTCHLVPLAALPMRHADYTLEQVQRVACRTVGDATQIFKEFLHKCAGRESAVLRRMSDPPGSDVFPGKRRTTRSRRTPQATSGRGRCTPIATHRPGMSVVQSPYRTRTTPLTAPTGGHKPRV